MITVNDREQFLDEVWKLMDVDSICAEIGVLYGDFSKMIYSKFTPIELVLIDPFKQNEKYYHDGLNYLLTAYSTQKDYESVLKKFENIHTVVINRCYSYEAVKGYENSFFDFIYHDASHLYEDIKRDLNDWLPKLIPGGLMCGHDYIQHESFGVIQAVDEFCKEHNFEMIILNENGGDYALRKIQ